MEVISQILAWIVANYSIVISAIVGILSGIIAISMLIPGDQPEKALQAVVDWISGLSRK